MMGGGVVRGCVEGGSEVQVGVRVVEDTAT